MAEYPQRTCGLCPHLAKYDAVAKHHGDYLQQNTVPQPNVLYEKRVTLDDHALGIPRTYEHPNLGAPVSLLEPVDCAPGQGAKAPQEKPCRDSPYALRKQEENKPTQPSTHGQQKAKAPPPPPPVAAVSTPNKGILKNVKRNETCPCEEKLTSKPACPEEEFNKPEVQRVVDVELRDGRPPCYLPQPEDAFPVSAATSGNLGPWATGRVDWSPLAGLTGTRPVVDKYSIARFSEGEWRAHNKQVLDESGNELHRGNLIDFNTRQALEQTRADTDKNQEDSTKRLMQREQELHRWKCELERAIDAAAEEIAFMEQERHRLKHASAVLMIPESIAGECLDRRTSRLDPELVRDEVEEELIKEMALTAEIRELFTRALKDVEAQLLEDKTSKQRLEYDWSDKRQAHDLEVVNVALNNKSNMMLFKPGAVRFPDNQSSAEHWENFTRETLQESEATRQRSVALRGTLDAILTNASRDLRAQAEKVDAALSRRIACTEEIRIRLENQLRKALQQLADVEDLIRDLKDALRRMDVPMKKAQTRLDNRNNRPRVENCRDVPQFGLVDEVKRISESVGALTSQLNQAEQSQADLMKTRCNLEREIMVKRKTLEIDRDRIQVIRTHYPSATALTGH